jgi:hypothetical protein
MTHNGSQSLHAILEELPSKDYLAWSGRGELWLPSPKGVQHGDVCHTHHDYAATRGDPAGILDPTNEAAPGGTTMRPAG